ncbi:MAG: hypothetical protein FJ290_32310 [Planctomycetes bacterium]|nr:hypothetical protein [Planctomycetota bacterium]
MKKLLCTVLGAAVALLGREAPADLMALNQRLDRAIYAPHAPKLVVAGEIARKNVVQRPPAPEAYPADVSFRFKVASVVLGQEKYSGQTLAIPATAFIPHFSPAGPAPQER